MANKKTVGEIFKYNKAVLDANVLFGGLTRNLLLSLAEARLYSPIWSEKILKELERNLTTDKVGVDFGYLRQQMVKHFPSALVKNFEWRETGLDLPSMKDVHVLAVAIATFARVIVTDNLKHFPDENLKVYNLTARSCDEFLSELIIFYESIAIDAIDIMRKSYNNPPISMEVLVSKISNNGLEKTAIAISKYLS